MIFLYFIITLPADANPGNGNFTLFGKSTHKPSSCLDRTIRLII